MGRLQFIKSTKEENLVKRYQDLLEIARLVSWCMNRDYLVKTCLDHISRRLGKRARCVLKEKDDLILHCWVGKYECSIEQVPICRDSIVWNVVMSGSPVNLIDPSETEGYRHTLLEKVKIKAIVPLWYVDNLTQEERRVGALIVDSGKKGLPISDEDYEYLQVVGELIGAAIGKAELTEQLIESYKRKEIMVRETAHVFRNRLTAIGGLSHHMVQLAKNTDLAKEARMVYEEAEALETQLERFEKYIGI
jgi:hypothetical protein